MSTALPLPIDEMDRPTLLTLLSTPASLPLTSWLPARAAAQRENNVGCSTGCAPEYGSSRCLATRSAIGDVDGHLRRRAAAGVAAAQRTCHRHACRQRRHEDWPEHLRYSALKVWRAVVARACQRRWEVDEHSRFDLEVERRFVA